MREINGCHSTSAYASKDIRIFHGKCASLVKVVQHANDSLQPANESLQLAKGSLQLANDSLQLAKRSVQLVKGILQLADEILWMKREAQGLLSVRLGVAEGRTGSLVHTLILQG